ncbi:Hypothetical_protein [Hexamita inflata]|uniref:Hypothetical_protein n=1 Tax=Hexamita inflata TaxID=28002 RepID=A0AA86QU54_9EUKA|nr:Hypothetical protein HINF_LOCUS48442 [Hexamita inflata]
MQEESQIQDDRILSQLQIALQISEQQKNDYMMQICQLQQEAIVRAKQSKNEQYLSELQKSANLQNDLILTRDSCDQLRKQLEEQLIQNALLQDSFDQQHQKLSCANEQILTMQLQLEQQLISYKQLTDANKFLHERSIENQLRNQKQEEEEPEPEKQENQIVESEKPRMLRKQLKQALNQCDLLTQQLEKQWMDNYALKNAHQLQISKLHTEIEKLQKQVLKMQQKKRKNEPEPKTEHRASTPTSEPDVNELMKKLFEKVEKDEKEKNIQINQICNMIQKTIGYDVVFASHDGILQIRNTILKRDSLKVDYNFRQRLVPDVLRFLEVNMK